MSVIHKFIMQSLRNNTLIYTPESITRLQPWAGHGIQNTLNTAEISLRKTLHF